MNVVQLVQTAVQDMVHTADREGILVHKRDGKIEFDGKAKFANYELDVPWVFVNHLKENKCLLWREMIYYGVMRRLPKHMHFVPSGCQGCYKVVVRPRTYAELLELDKAMHIQDWPSKIGVEKRDFVPALYGAYFYNRGLEAGQQKCNEVRKMVDFTLDPSVEVYLKRGCTEMEMEQGRSDKWKIFQFQIVIERLMEELIHYPEQPLQPEEKKTEVREKWKKFAWKWDRTYSGKEIYKDCIRYN